MDRRSRLDAALLVLALAIAAFSLRGGFCTDDHGFRALLRARPQAFVDMFRFASGEPRANLLRIVTGHLPWWTAPDFRLHLLRPLTGALFAVDVALFGDDPLGYHLHSLLWYAALLIAAARLFRRLLVAPAASLALAVFALRSAHVLPYAWISARHLVVGGALAAWALVVHLGPAAGGDGDRGLRARHLGAALLFTVALAGSEAALAGIALALALSFADVRRGAIRPVLGAVAPLLVVTVLYFVVYRLVGGGARASGDYHDPIGDPLGFLRVAAVRVPALLADALLAVPVVLASRHALAFALAGALAAVVLVLLLSTARARQITSPRLSLGLGLGALAGVVIGASGTLGGRVLLLPDLAFAALIGTVLAASLGSRLALLTAGVVLAVCHLLVAPVLSVIAIADLRHVARATEEVAADVAAEIPRGDSRAVFVIAASSPFVFLYPRLVLADVAPGRVDCWSVLSAAAADHRVERVDARTLRVRSEGRPLLDGFDALFRSPRERPFAAGDEVHQCGATVRVEEVDEGRPRTLLVTFTTSLDAAADDVDDDDRPLLFTWDGAHLRRFEPPSVAAPAVLVEGKRGPGRSGV